MWCIRSSIEFSMRVSSESTNITYSPEAILSPFNLAELLPKLFWCITIILLSRFA